MRTVSSVFLVSIILVACFFMSGCEMLTPGLKQARESFAASQVQFQETANELDAVAKELVDLKQQYDLATASGDQTKAQAILTAGMAAAAKYETLKSAADSSRRSYEVAAAELKKAEQSGNYVWGVLGLLFSGVTAFFGRSVGAAKPMAALTPLTEAIEAWKSGKPWAEEKTVLATKLTNAHAFNLVEKIRP